MMEPAGHARWFASSAVRNEYAFPVHSAPSGDFIAERRQPHAGWVLIVVSGRFGIVP